MKGLSENTACCIRRDELRTQLNAFRTRTSKAQRELQRKLQFFCISSKDIAQITSFRPLWPRWPVRKCSGKIPDINKMLQFSWISLRHVHSTDMYSLYVCVCVDWLRKAPEVLPTPESLQLMGPRRSRIAPVCSLFVSCSIPTFAFAAWHPCKWPNMSES